jgi:biopolymer transport protein ExbD
MKTLSLFGKSFVPSDAIEAEIDVDVKPMMNVLIILIPFLVSVAEYTRLAIIDMSLPPNITSVGGAGQGEKPKLKLTVVVTPSYFNITLGETMLDSIARKGPNGDYSYDTLSARLADRRLTAGIKDEVIVAPRDGIQFKYVVRVMDACRKTGFDKISLASATENPNSGQ